MLTMPPPLPRNIPEELNNINPIIFKKILTLPLSLNLFLSPLEFPGYTTYHRVMGPLANFSKIILGGVRSKIQKFIF